MYEIEKNIPVPTSHVKSGLLAALRAMSVGDSTLIPKVQRNSVAGTARNIPGAKFATRTVSATEVRVWRTE